MTILLIIIGLISGVVVATLALPKIRRALLSNPILAAFRKVMPPMSQTEADAINAGTVWWDGALFSGNPNWQQLLDYPRPQLNDEEQAFINNETERLCAMSDDWSTTHLNHDMPDEVWRYIKDAGFLGMIIPKKYGGKGFSAYAHSEVVQKLATRSSVSAVTVMVPNSLGPAELLMHYGTDEQKNYYLPRLARGTEVPAFGLTNPSAGSDAAAIPDRGVICRGLWQGKEVLGMRVTWDKRYITLGPVCTVLGLAFRLVDPDGLLGTKEDLGITCALVPTDTPGVNIGRRHLPLSARFQNGPNSGRDVFMPLDWIIGGPAMAGQGWRMLMECLAAGRSISLPSSGVGVAKLAVRGTGAYARVRSQFKTAIGKFEGIEEALARMGGNLYAMDAVRVMTAGAIDLGERPSVISGIAKYHLTERARAVVNDAMDIQGGKAICLGPSNFIGNAYQQMPISITVEGANILTRSLIIFGQGAIRCHPFVLKEMLAARDQDHARASVEFDAALWGHVRFALGNAVRTTWHGLTGGRFAASPPNAAPQLAHYYRQLGRVSASFALLADFSMLVLGGSLKRREMLSARLGDILSQLYIASCVLKRFEDNGRQSADLPLAQWALDDSLNRIQQAFDGVLANFPNRTIAWTLKRVMFPWGAAFPAPSDALGQAIARLLITPSPARDRLTHNTYIPNSNTEIMGQLEAALAATVAAEAIMAKVRVAQKNKRIRGHDEETVQVAALAAGIITAEEKANLDLADDLRAAVIRVDDFPQDFGLSETLRHTATAPATTQRVAA